MTEAGTPAGVDRCKFCVSVCDCVSERRRVLLAAAAVQAALLVLHEASSY